MTFVRKPEAVGRTSCPAFCRVLLCKQVTAFPASLSSPSSNPVAKFTFNHNHKNSAHRRTYAVEFRPDCD